MEKPEYHSRIGWHIGIDFGRNVTVIAASHRSSGITDLVACSGISRDIPRSGNLTPVPVIPSAICYHADGTWSIGEEASSPTWSGSHTTFQRLVYYLCVNSTALESAGPGRKIGYRDAGADYLSELVKRAAGGVDLASAEITFTSPLGAPIHYVEWIASIADLAGIGAVSTTDIGCAVVRGYGLPFDDNELYLVIDASTDYFDVAVITPERNTGVDFPVCSRVLGRASAEFGGFTTDSWVASEFIKAKRRSLSDDEQGNIFKILTDRCRRARENLTVTNEISVLTGDLFNGPEDHVDLTHADVTRIFREHGLFAILDRTIARALSAAQVNGFDRDRITAVLMIGDLSLLASVPEAVCAQFTPALVWYDHALDAAARGAAALVETSRKIPIRNDYALRYWEPVSREHRYRLLVRRGARYPSAGQVARVLISAAYDGQTQLGIPLYQIKNENESTFVAGLELVGSPDGGLRIAGPVRDCTDGFRPVKVENGELTFLSAIPPAQKGIPRFELTFTLDGQGYLCMTVRDISTGTLVRNASRVHKLT